MAPVPYRALPEPGTLLPPQTASRLAPPPTCVALAADGERAAVGVGSVLHVLDLRDGDRSAARAPELWKRDVRARLHCVAFDEDGEILAAGDGEGRCHVFHVDGTALHVLHHIRPERLLNKSADESDLMERRVSGLAFARGHLATCGRDGGLSLWRLDDGTRAAELYAELLDDPDDDGRSAADKARDRRVLGWLSPGLRRRLTPAPAPPGYLCACFAPDEKSIVAGGERDELHVWTSHGGEWASVDPAPSRTLKGHAQWVVALAWSGATLVSLDAAGVLLVWRDFEQIKQLRPHEQGAGVALRGPWLVTCGDANLRVWDLESFACRHTIHVHELRALGMGVAFENEGEGFRVATYGGDRRTLVWKIEEAALCGEGSVAGLPGHAWREDPETRVGAACFAGDSLVTCDRARFQLQAYDMAGRPKTTATHDRAGGLRPPARFAHLEAGGGDRLVTISEEGRCSTWRLDDDMTPARSWAYHGDLRPRGVCATWAGGPVCSCDVAGTLLVVDPGTGGLVTSFDGFEASDGGWAFADLGGDGAARSWCLVSFRGTRLVAFDPHQNEAHDLIDLPGHCGTVLQVAADGVPSEAFADDRHLRVVALDSGGVAFAWAPTAKVGDAKCRGGLVELALPPGAHERTVADHSGRAADQAVERVIDAVKERRQGVHRAHVRRAARADATTRVRQRVALVGVATFIKDGRHCVLGWSKHRVGLWRDDARTRKGEHSQRLKYRLALVVDFDRTARVHRAHVHQNNLYVVTQRGWLHRIDVGEILDESIPGDENVQRARRSSKVIRGRLSTLIAWEEPESSADEEPEASPAKVNSNLSSLMKFSERRRETRQADFASIARARATRRSIKPGRPSMLRRGVQQGRLAGANAPVARAGAQAAPRARRESAVIRAGRLADEALAPALEEIGEGDGED